jgi:hypothetical protein
MTGSFRNSNYIVPLEKRETRPAGFAPGAFSLRHFICDFVGGFVGGVAAR